VPVLEDAFSAIPGYAEAKTAVDTIKTWRAPQLVTAGAERRRIAAELAAAAKAGQAMPPDLVERLEADQRRGALQSEVALLITETLTQAQQELKQTAAAGIHDGYQFLQHRLDELCDEVRTDRDTLTALIGVDADAAIRSGRVEQWQRAEQLVDRYAEIRHAHYVLISMENLGVQRHVFAVSGQLEDPCDTDPFWVTRRMYNSGLTRSDLPDPEYRRHVDWLIAAQGRPVENHQRSDVFPSTMTPINWLLTLVDHNPWVPDATTLADAHATEFTATGPDLTAAQARTRMTTRKETANA
jgi:hypothetical protein